MNDKKYWEKQQIALLKAPPETLPKKKLALEQALQAAEKVAKNSEQSYRVSIEKLHAVDKKYYEKLGELMGRLEDLDRKRVNVVKSVCEHYVQLQDDMAKCINEFNAAMKQSFNKIDAEEDIQSFIHGSQSGAVPPPPADFEPYSVHIPDEFGPIRSPFDGKSSMDMPRESTTPAVSATPTIKPPAPSVSIGSSKPAAPVAAAEEPKAAPAAASSSKRVLKRVRVLYDYTPAGGDELTIHEGEICEVSEMNDDGWWYGECNGKAGFFPSNFVADLDTDDAPAAANHAAPAEDPFNSSQSSHGSGSGETCVASFDYEATDANELSFKEGDVIEILSKSENGWWFGQLSGKQGLFPSNYVTPQ